MKGRRGEKREGGRRERKRKEGASWVRLRQFLWVNNVYHSQHVRAGGLLQQLGRRGKREGEIGSISKGHTSFSKTFLVLNLADCSQNFFQQQKLRLRDSLLVSLFDGVGGVGHGGHAKLKVQGAPL